MTVRTFFTILAVLSFLFGIGFVLAPGQVLANYGIDLSPALALVGRLTASYASCFYPMRSQRLPPADATSEPAGPSPCL